MRARRFVVASILCLAAGVSAQEEARKPVQVTDLLQLERLGSVAVSPDGCPAPATRGNGSTGCCASTSSSPAS